MNSNSRTIDKVPFTLHPLVGLMHNNTTAKEPTNCARYDSKKNIEVSFATPGIEKKVDFDILGVAGDVLQTALSLIN